MRVRKKPWALNELTTNKFLITAPEDNKGAWHSFFGNNNPIHVEIGCGKGNFISTMATLNPQINFIGIERQKYVIAPALRKISDDTSNICMILGDCDFLINYFDDKEIDRIYINFCDPWPKKKWAKRRLTHKNYLSVYKCLLKENGEIHFKTDNMPLFEFSLNELCGFNMMLKNISLDLHSSDFEGNVMTEYEEKFSSKGMPIYRLEGRF